MSEILHERRPITLDVAIRLGAVLGALWLKMQQAVDFWDMLAKHKAEYHKLKRLTPLARPVSHL